MNIFNRNYISLIKLLVGLGRSSKTLLVILVDFFMLVAAFWCSLSIRLNEIYYPTEETKLLILFAPLLAVPILYLSGLYKSLIRYSNYQSLIWIMTAVTAYSLLWFSIVLLSGIVEKPYDFLVINWMLSILFVGGIRYLARWLLVYRETDFINIAIYGAGSSGIQLRSALLYSNEIKAAAFLDDNINLQGTYLDGLRVYRPENIEKLIKNKSISEIYLAMPNQSKSIINEIIKTLNKYSVVIRILPSFSDIAKGRVSISDLKKIRIEDLLKRDSRKPIDSLLTRDVTNRSILVTGAGGSIGSQLCREIVELNPKKLILFDISEYSLYQLENELLSRERSFPVITVIGNVTNKARLKKVITSYQVETVYHAAAYKHVPLVEKNTIAGVRCNIFGTLSCIQAACEGNVSSFVFISTDKAVRPTNVMGATKRFAELILQAYAKEFNSSLNKTRIRIVRFGNVLGSSGSVVPLFTEQIEKGGPITVTDPEIIRYFMTLEEASQLVIQAGSMGSEADIFLLDMGEPIHILDLAKDMIKLSGRTIRDSENPKGDIEIVFTGLRPGEKLCEELLIDGDVQTTEHEKILCANEPRISLKEVTDYINDLELAINQDNHKEIVRILKETVQGFKAERLK
mgnify:CR=1 FL=1